MSRLSHCPRLLVLLLVAAGCAVLVQAQSQSVMRRLEDAAWPPRSESVAYSNPVPQSVQSDVGRLYVPAGSLWVYGSRGRSDVWVSTDAQHSSWHLAGGEGTAYGGGSSGGSWTTDLRRTADCDDPITGRVYGVSGQDAGAATSRVAGTSNGYEWEVLAEAAVFFPREEPACAVDYSSAVFVLGGSTAIDGQLPLVSSNDVWVSRDLGSTWQLVTLRASWPRRINADAAALNGSAVGLPNGALMLMNGDGRLASADQLLNDVWLSTNSARTWQQVTARAPWSARKDSELTVTALGVLIVTGGDDGPSVVNDVRPAPHAAAEAQLAAAADPPACCPLPLSFGPVSSRRTRIQRFMPSVAVSLFTPLSFCVSAAAAG